MCLYSYEKNTFDKLFIKKIYRSNISHKKVIRILLGSAVLTSTNVKLSLKDTDKYTDHKQPNSLKSHNQYGNEHKKLKEGSYQNRKNLSAEKNNQSFLCKYIKQLDEDYEKEVRRLPFIKKKLQTTLGGISNSVMKSMLIAMIPFLARYMITFNPLPLFIKLAYIVMPPLFFFHLIVSSYSISKKIDKINSEDLKTGSNLSTNARKNSETNTKPNSGPNATTNLGKNKNPNLGKNRKPNLGTNRKPNLGTNRNPNLGTNARKNLEQNKNYIDVNET
ncbi:CPSF (cleavage and polyadenylation specific factor), subunit A, putative [Plasmodium malariae]|uniref:CPSF (Cleavage and polyadenylation specific factor), subunit A, putative n=1 Tax=Plasmodium malariae TaxID=5858 RepID=A0A1A8XD17_PLAMA|nr:CPSF (cleavage and polyadenylation specific factor), subunit A, putative [Plasmodium malariae]